MRFSRLLSFVVLLLVVAVLALLCALRSYQLFTGEELVAVIQCEVPPEGSPYRYLLRFSSFEGASRVLSQEFPMHGDQWSVGGDILKWHPWLNWIGLKNCYKLTRVSSRYLKAQDEIKNPKSAYDLNGGTDSFWRWLYRWGRSLPLVEAVYGNTAYTMAEPGSRWGVYVTLSGYLVKPLPGPPIRW